MWMPCRKTNTSGKAISCRQIGWETLTTQMFSFSQHVVKQHYRLSMFLNSLHTRAADPRQHMCLKTVKPCHSSHVIRASELLQCGSHLSTRMSAVSWV